MVVLSLIGLVVAVTVPRARRGCGGPTLLTQSRMREVCIAMLAYHQDAGDFLHGVPQSGELASLLQQRMSDYLALPEGMCDGWNRSILYERCTGEGGEFLRLRSLGRDGNRDANDSVDDILMDIGVAAGVVVWRFLKQSMEWEEPLQ